MSLAPLPDGSVKVLIFKGASSAKTAKGIKYIATDVAVPDHQKLNRMILEGGFTHHLAVAMADIEDEARMLFDFLGVPWVSPDVRSRDTGRAIRSADVHTVHRSTGG